MSKFCNQWFISTPIEEGELLSSWLIRSALDMGCSPLVLIEVLWGDLRALTIDLDKRLSKWQLDRLLIYSFETKASIDKTLLCNIFHKIHDKNYFKQNAIWILSLGLKNRSNLAGRQVCCECFVKDKRNPYLRLRWRMAWHTCCEIHNIKLIDKCENCSVSLHPYKIGVEHQYLSICSECGFDLKRVQSTPAEQAELMFQKQADLVLKQGYGDYDGKKVTSVEWFTIARSWLSEIRIIINSKNQNFIRMFEALGVQINIQILTPIAFENLSTRERSYLISILYEIMKIPCEKIVLYSKKFGINQSNFWDKRQNLHPILSDMKNCITISNKKGSLRNCKNVAREPKDKKTVQRKWMKLTRKYNQILGGAVDKY